MGHFTFCLWVSIMWRYAGNVGAFSLNNDQPQSSRTPQSSSMSASLPARDSQATTNTHISSPQDVGSTSSNISWHMKEKPFLAIITETDACDSDQRMKETFLTIQNALGECNENNVDLISIRVTPPKDPDHIAAEFQSRIVELTRRLMALKQKYMQVHADSRSYNEFMVVVNDNVEAAIEADSDGVHVKENDTANIPYIKDLFFQKRRGGSVKEEIKESNRDRIVLIGTSAHTLESALSNWELYQPNYFFVGTCYMTQSHPEKLMDDLEGPMLPGIIKRAICNTHDKDESDCEKRNLSRRSIPSPIFYAIGGIDFDNCREPVQLGADGVAVIRSVMQAPDPAKIVSQMKDIMKDNERI